MNPKHVRCTLGRVAACVMVTGLTGCSLAYGYLMSTPVQSCPYQEFMQTHVYAGMLQTEFEALLAPSNPSSPLRLLRAPAGRYELGWQSRTRVATAYFHERRLASIAELTIKGMWVPETWWSTPSWVKIARLRIQSPTRQVEDLAAPIEQLLIQLGHEPGSSGWKWWAPYTCENEEERKMYTRTFDANSTPPQPVLRIYILSGSDSSSLFEVRVVPDDYPRKINEKGYYVPVHPLPINYAPGNIPYIDFNFLDAYASRFSGAVDAFTEALRNEFGADQVVRLQ